MTPTRTDLNFEKNNSTYIILTVILVILSSLGVYLFFQLQKKPNNVIVEEPVPTEIPSPTPKLIEIDEPTIDPSPTVKSSPTTKPTLIPTTSTISTTSSQSPLSTPLTQNFSSSIDKFSVVYSSGRKLYEDKESTGNRYTFYSKLGNIAIHTGTKWSWVYPNREFTDTLLVAGKPTFVYDLDSQKIVDFENGDQKYTIQCIHGGSSIYKAECDKFISSFKLL